MFILENICEEVLNGEEMVLKSYDQDVLVDDFIGATRPLPW
jgi:hypothetical protein